MANPPRMKEPFPDPAVPDGAETMGDDWLKTDAGGGGAAGGSAGGGGDEAEAGAKYFAACSDCPQYGGWKGPNRDSADAAQADADAHNGAHPGHRASVVYP